jgi:hypothetical protein
MSLFKPAENTMAYRATKPAAIRFWKHVTFEPNSGCWLWAGTMDGKGYGTIKKDFPAQGKVPAHRLSFEMSKGAIASGLDIDHLCFNRACVNPDHLEMVTRKENIRRGVNGPNRNPNYERLSQRTHCKRGHPFSPENTHNDPRKPKRTCKICRRAMQAAARKARKEAINVHV